MRITIHQPEHMPWLGFFHKVNMADVYVVLDSIKYRKLYFQNRNKVRTSKGWQWVTVPLLKHNDNSLLNKIRIFKENPRYKRKNIDLIWQNYNKAKYFGCYWDEFKAIYSKDYESLSDFNLELIKFFLRSLDIQIKIVIASSLDVKGVKSELNLNICKSVGAKTYISGISGKNYLDVRAFKDANIDVVFQEFHHPIYRQLYEPFIACMSIIDLLFNYGEKSLEIINGTGVPVMKEIFF